jgi:signal peptidase I
VSVALIVAILLRMFVLQVFFIPSSSMVPTLAVDDRILVEKLSYRFREPVRGDVIVFAGERTAAETADDALGPVERLLRPLGIATGLIPPSPSDLVKRLIGLPGEEVAVIGGVLHVDGVALAEGYLSGPVASDFGPVTVPDDAYFFLGDNRRNSADSRGSLGFVARDRVIGRAVVVAWPLGNAASLIGQRPVPLPQMSSAG